MTQMNDKLRPGDLVEVLSAEDILQKLDSNACLDGLPFMPEMLEFCGRRFRVFRTIQKTCVDMHPMDMREFENGEVVYLEQLRCSGLHHGGCQRACMLFWKTDWLRKVTEAEAPARVGCPDSISVESRLRISNGAGQFFCQSTELGKSTRHLSRNQRLRKCVRDLRAGNFGPLQMLGFIVGPIYWKIFRFFFGHYPGGSQTRTPDVRLDLQPGELVEVKSLPEIRATLDKDSKNRGLEFSPDMVPFCGRQFRVRTRLDRMIIEPTGQMRPMKNTVILEGANCNCNYVLGGCPRLEFQFFREIWLKRVAQNAENVSRENHGEEVSRI